MKITKKMIMALIKKIKEKETETEAKESLDHLAFSIGSKNTREVEAMLKYYQIIVDKGIATFK